MHQQLINSTINADLLAKAPIDIEAVVRSQRCGIEYFDPEVDNPDLVDTVSIYDGSSNIFYVNKTLTIGEQRFALGHALAHLLVHKKNVAIDYFEQHVGMEEYEADEFALEVLMPEHLVIIAISELPNIADVNGNIATLAVQFNMEKMHVSQRLQKLRLI